MPITYGPLCRQLFKLQRTNLSSKLSNDGNPVIGVIRAYLHQRRVCVCDIAPKWIASARCNSTDQNAWNRFRSDVAATWKSLHVNGPLDSMHYFYYACLHLKVSLIH